MSTAVQAGSIASRFPVYQIDFSAVASGKRIATTKRRIRWRFGFSNAEALEAGETGTACRGEEHDVTIIWSVTSGKRQITCDGQEVHYSSNRSGVVDFTWPLRGSHTIKVIAHASPPLSATPGFRQYDMFVDGQSYFNMPKVYELGLRGAAPSQGSRGVSGMHQQPNLALPPPADPEDADLQRAIRESLEESRMHLARTGQDNYQQAPAPAAPKPAPVAAGASDLLGFDAPAPAPPALQPLPAPAAPPAVSPMAAPAPSYYGAPAPVNSAASVSPSVSTIGYQGAPTVAADALTVMTAPPAQPAPAYGSPYGADAPSFTSAPQPIPVGDSFAQPMPPADDPFAPKPPPPATHNDIASAILGAYGNEPAPSPGAVPVTPIAEQGGQPYQTPQLENGHAENTFSPGLQLSMNSPLEEEKKDEPQSDVDRALKNLVNFDDINAPAEQEMSLTMKPKEEKKGKPNKSKAIPPKAVFGAATLEQVKAAAPAAPTKSAEEIMKPPPQLFSPGAVNAGALVVHGQQGPPPIQTGFGVGAQMGGYGYGAPQMQYQQPPPMQYQQAPMQYQQPPPPQYGYTNY